MTAVLEIESLSFAYQNETEPVLRNISFTLERGERVALIGSNGSGKSTLLKSCVRLVEPYGGSIRVMGKDVISAYSQDLRSIRSNIGFVFQQHNLVPTLSLLSNVIQGSLFRNPGPQGWFQSLAKEEDRKLALECLQKVGLEHLAMKRVDTLSGGQSQRVAIARSLMQKPSILFADEPSASLDPVSGKSVMELFAKLAKEDDIAVLFTTHAKEEAISYADRVIGLQKGKITLNTPAGQVVLTDLDFVYEQ